MLQTTSRTASTLSRTGAFAQDRANTPGPSAWAGGIDTKPLIPRDPLVLDPLFMNQMEDLHSPPDAQELETRLREGAESQAPSGQRAALRLAQLLAFQRRFDEAETTLRNRTARFTDRRSFEPQLARIYAARGDDETAEQLLVDAIERAEAGGSRTKHAAIAVARSACGYFLLERGRFIESEQQLLAAHDAAQNVGPRFGHGRGILRALIELYEALGEANKAESYRKLLAEESHVRR